MDIRIMAALYLLVRLTFLNWSVRRLKKDVRLLREEIARRDLEMMGVRALDKYPASVQCCAAQQKGEG